MKPRDDLYYYRIRYFLGLLMQGWDDYIDVYPGPHAVADDQNDISERRMTLLLIMALEHANKHQRRQLLANYGSYDSEKVKIVKTIFDELQIGEKIKAYEAKLVRILDEEVKNIRTPSLRRIFSHVIHTVHDWHN